MSRQHDFYERVYGEHEARFKGKPHAWIQWKGTDACMDVYCRCGEHFHIDAEFAYRVKCPACKKVWVMALSIDLIDPPADVDFSESCEPQEGESFGGSEVSEGGKHG